MRERKLNLVCSAISLLLLLLFVVNAEAFTAHNRNDQKSDDFHRVAGAVYALTNEATGNKVAIFLRNSDGTLTPASRVATGGLGSGSGLGSQGAIVLSEDEEFLFAVNAGSNEISSFAITGNGLRLIGAVQSGGINPISLTVHEDLLYVLNAGGSGNITGFSIMPNGGLRLLAGSTRPLSSGSAGPAQVEFNPWGDILVVTEKATNIISTYTVDEHGLANGPTSNSSSGMTPFGFAFDKRGRLIVSEAFGGAANQSATSSYHVSENGVLQVISESVGTNQTAACWIVVTKNSRFAYESNTGSGSITGYRILRNGTLVLLDADGRTGVTGDGSQPIDMALSLNSRYLYALNAGNGTIAAFRVRSDGHLNPIPGAGGLPASAVGLAAR